MNKKTLKTLATGAAITLATVGASTVSANTQYGIQLNRVTGEWQTVNHVTGEIVKSEPNGTYSTYDEANAGLSSWLETQASTVETPAAETTAVEVPKTIAEVQSEVDAQQAVVDATAAEANQAQADADAANQAIATAQAEVDTATQAVKDAEVNAANATPENIAANQTDQTANLADQQANATETDEVNAEIADQTNKVADAQTAVDTAQAEKDAADANVTAKEADVKAAQDAISGTGLAEAQANLDNASKAVTDAKANVNTATQAFEDAKKADADRDAKIKAAETEVAVKSDAVDTAKAKLTAAQDAAKRTSDTVTKATDAVAVAKKALESVGKPQNIYEAINAEIADKTGAIYFKDKTADLTAKMAEFKRLIDANQDQEAQDYAEKNLLGAMLKAYIDVPSQEFVKALVGETAFNKTYTLQNGKLVLSKEDYTALNIAFASQLNAFRKISGFEPINKVTEYSVEQGLKAIDAWNEFANRPENADLYGSELRHRGFGEVEKVTSAYNENIYPTGGFRKSSMTFTELNTLFAYNMLGFAFSDAHANWGHYYNLLQGSNIMMGLYQNNVGGAYFTHGFSDKESNDDIVIYSQTTAAVVQAHKEELEKAKADIEAYKTLLKNDLTYIKLMQDAANFDNQLRDKYNRTGSVTDVEYAQRDALSQKVTDYEKEHNIVVPEVDSNIIHSSRVIPSGYGTYTVVETDDSGNLRLAKNYYGNYIIDVLVDQHYQSDLDYVQNKLNKAQALHDTIKDKLVVQSDLATLQANLTQAQANLTAAQTASDSAKAELTKASSDYATALEAKTAAEKTLADATATPLQTQVAENNLRLATIALQNAEARKADAQKAVDNFSANLAEKKAALDTAKAELATAQATATAKAEALKTAQANLASQQATLDSLNKERDALLAEKGRLVEEAKALATELKGYLEAPAILAEAQATLTEKQAALTEAQAKAETAQNKLETVTAKLAAEESKLAELQAEYDKLKDLEDKAKDNVIATLPDGTVIAVPKDAPTAVEKPAINIDAVKDAITKGQDVTVVDGKVVVASPQAGVTVTPQGITYSRAERAKALPQTGEQESILGLVGLAMMSTLGLAGARRKRRG
ncbi:TPA: SEC10/PgrA surface exclusion domain-containing protein [Streptococcus suis]|nr:SEC10/PgrA surface exclusion domain-containing protein [Streptococcus suis]HEM6419574.1 SEC10/PgrA surface exclusion domain-containing protein [Streptococcus suis]HEM6425763.1 SEC10/PgrA surface exclusion domain-containing protein [Streptococcus suis]